MNIVIPLLALGLSASTLAAPPLLVSFGDPQTRSAAELQAVPVGAVAISPLILHWYDADGQLVQRRQLFDPRIL